MLTTFKYIETKPGVSRRVGDCLIIVFESITWIKRSSEDMFTALCDEFDPLGEKSDLYVDDFGVSHGKFWVKVIPKHVALLAF